jgi:hypothetical protein
MYTFRLKIKSRVMDYLHQNLLNGKFIKTLLVSDIYQTRIGKLALKFTIIFYLALLVAQLYFFFLAAITENLINHANL